MCIRDRCIIAENSINIESSKVINDSLLQNVIVQKKSLFQQTLLLKNGEIIDCNLFGSNSNLRRALIEFEDNTFFVAESSRNVTITEFQKALKEIGAMDAINLDMGSWSEGWYKNFDGSIKIGENFLNTHRQTNWIIYSNQ